MVSLNKNEFARHKNIRTKVKQRLIAEGRYDDYRNLIANMRAAGLPDSGDLAAWKVAAFAFAPISGGPGELKADPMYEQIAADWANGKYKEIPLNGFAKFPSGMTNFEEVVGGASPEMKAAVEKAKRAPSDWKQKWKEIARQVEVDNADQVVEVLWVAAHRWTDPDDIDPAEVPSKAALGKLSLVQESSANYAEFLRTFESKLMPDKRAIEYESRFRDTGQDLKLLEEFEQQWREEESHAGEGAA